MPEGTNNRTGGNPASPNCFEDLHRAVRSIPAHHRHGDPRTQCVHGQRLRTGCQDCVREAQEATR
jgi:hypothetical protein